MAFIEKLARAFRLAFTFLVIELPAQGSGMDRIIHRLESTGRSIEKRTASVKNRPNNIETLRHMIGIERWGQQRLKVALGEPFSIEEYDAYRPETDDWRALRAAFHAARQDTISLAKSLRMARLDPHMRVRHNQFGEMSLLGWIFYLYQHAHIESKRIH